MCCEGRSCNLADKESGGVKGACVSCQLLGVFCSAGSVRGDCLEWQLHEADSQKTYSGPLELYGGNYTIPTIFFFVLLAVQSDTMIKKLCW